MRPQNSIDVLLIDAQFFYYLDYSHSNMGLISIASFLESRGFRVKLVSTMDYFEKPADWLEKLFKAFKPKITGFYLASDNYEIVGTLASQIKTWLPATWIVGGGPLAASIGEQVMNENPAFNAVVTGEGEYAMETICNALIHNKGDILETEGLILRRDGELVRGKPANPITDLDALPFPGIRYLEKQQVFRVISGRGCPYRCTFCFQPGHGLKHRLRSAENVLEEIIGNLEARPFIGIDFIDDVLVMDPDRAFKIAEGIEEYRRKTGRQFHISVQARVNILAKHPDLVPALAKAGVNRIQLGIESGNPDTLRYYNKGITPDQVRTTIEAIRDTQSIMAYGGFIMGGPFESEKTFKNTVDLAVELIEMAPGAFAPNAGFLCAYPGTEIAANPEKYGLTKVEPDFRKSPSASDVQFVTEHFPTKTAIRGLKQRFMQETRDAMIRSVSKIPPRLLRMHYLWAERFQSYSQWFNTILGSLGVVSSYYRYLDTPRFRKMATIPKDELASWYSMRLVIVGNYQDDGSLKMPPSIKDVTLTDPAEILAYELSLGKMTLGAIAEQVKAEHFPDRETEDILHNFVAPVLGRLEETYHVVFFR